LYPHDVYTKILRRFSEKKKIRDYTETVQLLFPSHFFPRSAKTDALAKRLVGGLEKLIEASESVAAMSIELADKVVIVDENAKNVTALIEDINQKTEVANKRQIEANEAQTKIEEDNIVIVREKADADEALAAALPALAAAAAALEGLEKKDITEVKSMAKPPMPVMIVIYYQKYY
jgi:dynein heavy chain, axonemal